MEINLKIKVATDFTDAPGARYRSDGDKSGQEFYEEILKPKFEEAISSTSKLEIDLDGTWGYASSFLSESFGKLSIEFGKSKVKSLLSLVSEEDPDLIEKINSEIDNPQ